MKKILFFLAFAVSNVLSAQQQEVHFMNLSSYDIFISYIITTTNADTNGSGSPKLTSVTPLGITVTSGTTYSAVDSTPATPPASLRFPYQDFTGISQWSDTAFGTISSSLAYLLRGTGQKFYFAKISVADPSLPVSDGGNIGQNFGASQSYIPGAYVDFYFSANYPDPIGNPTWVIYTVLAI